MQPVVAECCALAALTLLVLEAVMSVTDAAYVSGSCPPAVALRRCTPTCQRHAECPGALLCCGTACGGTACVRSVTDVQRALQLEDGGESPGCCPRPGACPPLLEGDWLCASRCRGDFDCEAPAKCCPTRCGALDCAAPAQPAP